MRAMKASEAVGRRFREHDNWIGVCSHIDHPQWLPWFIGWFDVIELEFAGGRIPSRHYFWDELKLAEDES